MDTQSPGARYTVPAQALHWLIAGLIASQYILAKFAEHAEDANLLARQLALLANHKSVGITILGLAVLRVSWRVFHSPPSLPANMARWQAIASHASHLSIYLLIFIIPVSGWLMSSASAYSVSWFNLITLPDMISPDPDAKHRFLEIHEFLVKVLFVIVLIHIGAAFKHHLIDKDDILKRMTSPFALLLFVVTAAGTSYTLTRSPTASADTSPPDTSSSDGEPAPTSAPAEPVASPSSLPVWTIDYQNSGINFVAEQAGANFEGRWKDWSANMQFDPAKLDDSVFDVTIDVGSVDTRDEERDATLMGQEWFHQPEHRTVRFVTDTISATGQNEFAAASRLVVKGHSTPVLFTFTLAADGTSRVLTGSATLDRIRLRVGTGEWEDTEWVGQFVDVNVRVAASVSE